MGRPTLNRTCDINGCGRSHYARGLCRLHMRRLQRNGDPLVRKKPANGEALAFYIDQVIPYDGDECLIWPFTRDKQGYGKIMMGGKNKTVSRLLCEEANGPPPSQSHDAAHSCGNGKFGCVTNSHLRWATRKENMADTLAHGTRNRGSRNGQAKLTEGDVLSIRQRARAETHAAIARDYGMSRIAITDIVSGRNWGWLQSSGPTVSGGGLY